MKVVKIKDMEMANAYYNPKIKKHIVLSAGELENIYSLALAIIPPGEISGAHSHHNVGEVFFVRSGQGRIRINDDEFDFAEGVCAVVEPEEVHEIENTGTVNLELLYFEVITRSGDT